jgi:hypothetical protein
LDFDNAHNNINWNEEYQANIKDEVEIKSEVPDEVLCIQWVGCLLKLKRELVLKALKYS